MKLNDFIYNNGQQPPIIKVVTIDPLRQNNVINLYDARFAFTTRAKRPNLLSPTSYYIFK